MRAFFLLMICHISSIVAHESLDLKIPLEELDTRGFTVLHHLFSPDEVEQMSHRFQVIKDRAFHIIENTPPIERLFAETNQHLQSFYWKMENELILQAGRGRYDFYRGFSKDLFSSAARLPHPILEELMTKLMGGEFTSYSGVIHSMIGSEDQYWHRDTNTLDNVGSDGAQLVLLDDFYFTVLIPIKVPFTEANGTTEFVAGSHRLSAKESAACEKAQLEVPLGSALVFNGKIIHRGRANQSSEDRPVLYIVYHKKWYNDHYRKGIESF